MALIKCKECGNEVSSKAKQCPKCGAPITVDGGCLQGCFAVCVFLFVCLFLLALGGLMMSRLNTGSRSELSSAALASTETPPLTEAPASTPISSQPGATSKAKPQRGAPAINLAKLIGQSPAGVEKELGKAAKITPIDDDPQLMPGEYRDYHVKGSKSQIMVRFHRGKVASVVVFFDEGEHADTATLLARFGLTESELTKTSQFPLATEWGGWIGKSRFLLKAFRNTSDSTRWYQARVQFPSG